MSATTSPDDTVAPSATFHLMIVPDCIVSERRGMVIGIDMVFAESEVINHVSSGRAPGDILHGAVVSLVARSVQLMKRVRLEQEITLVGGIMRFPTMVRVLREELGQDVNVPPEPLAQFTAAIGAAVLGQQRLAKRAAEHAAA